MPSLGAVRGAAAGVPRRGAAADGPRAGSRSRPASSLGWEKYIGPFGAVVAIDDRFGASAPLKVVMEKYGFTADNVAAKAVEVVEQLPARLAASGLKKA